LACVYYILQRAGKDELADRMVDTLRDPSRAPIGDPFFTLRNWLMLKKKERAGYPQRTFAVIFKACNAAYRGEQVKALMWKEKSTKGRTNEAFPVLEPDIHR